VHFTVTNTDSSLPTSNQGPNGGDYNFNIVVTDSTGSSTTNPQPAFELVPTTTIPQVTTAPTLDGTLSPGEYDSAPTLDLSRLWEGTPCDSPADCSGWAKVVWNAEDLYFYVHVTDDVMGKLVTQADCKRHWRTDSVEIAIDPRGNSENTGTTFKTGIFPATAEGGPCWERDADNNQGPGATTAPGMQVVSHVTSPYTGYDLEVKIPTADLPAAIDPSHMGLNIFIYDSDTQDLTGQTRLGWSTWGGVQGDPYRWGIATLPGYTPPPGQPTVAPPPTIPNTAAQSIQSPQSIAQSARDGVPLAGEPRANIWHRASLADRPQLVGSSVKIDLRSKAAGTAYVFIWSNDQVVASVTATHAAGSNQAIMVPLSADALASIQAHGGTVLIGWVPQGSDGSTAIAAPIGT